MNIFDQYVEKILYELYNGSEKDKARKLLHDTVVDIVSCAQMDMAAVDEFLGFNND
jgi:hypothetical protein